MSNRTDSRGRSHHVLGSHCLHRIISLRCFSTQHDAVSTVQNGIGHVTALCTCGAGLLDHAFQHLHTQKERERQVTRLFWKTSVSLSLILTETFSCTWSQWNILDVTKHKKKHNNHPHFPLEPDEYFYVGEGYFSSADLCGTDDWLSCSVAATDHHLLGQEHFLCGNFDPQVTAGDHDAITSLHDLIKPGEVWTRVKKKLRRTKY